MTSLPTSVEDGVQSILPVLGSKLAPAGPALQRRPAKGLPQELRRPARRTLAARHGQRPQRPLDLLRARQDACSEARPLQRGHDLVGQARRVLPHADRRRGDLPQDLPLITGPAGPLPP